MYQMETEIPFTKSGKDGKLKLHEAVSYMMDCCQFQEYQENAFCEFLRKNRIAIFLFSIQIDILQMPSFREKVSTAVKIYGCKSIYGLRRITMKDEMGNICLISNATGAFFDLKSGKAVKIDPATLPIRFDEPEPMECLPRKIPIPVQNGKTGESVTVMPSELDPNGHLTSPEYFQIASNVLPPDFTFNRVRVEYKKQAKPGVHIIPVSFEIPGGIIVDMRDEEGLSFAVAEFSQAEL